MKLFLLRPQTSVSYYDEYLGAIVAAKDEQAARNIHPSGRGFDVDMSGGTAWCRPEKVEVTLIGTAVRGTKSGVIIADLFKAG